MPSHGHERLPGMTRRQEEMQAVSLVWCKARDDFPRVEVVLWPDFLRFVEELQLGGEIRHAIPRPQDSLFP